MNHYTYQRRLLATLLLILLSTTAMAQGKAVEGESQQLTKARQLYQQGDYQQACDILFLATDHSHQRLQSRITIGLTIFLLIDIIGIFLFLYIEKRKAYRLLVEKNADCAQRPVFDPHAIDFNVADANEGIDRTLLESLQKLFEQEKIHLDSDLKIDQVAQRLGTSRAVVSHLTNQYLGRSFPALVNQYRIGEAVRLLLDPKTCNYKLDAIGSLCGYNNRQVFHAAFKKETGLTPLEFKQAALAKD